MPHLLFRRLGLIGLILALIVPNSPASAARLTPDQLREVVATYRNLLVVAGSSPRSPTQSLFTERETLTLAQIEQATRSVHRLLSNRNMPLTVSRIGLLEQIRLGEALGSREKYSLLFELETLDQLIQNQLDQEDQKRNRRKHFIGRLASIGLVAAASLIEALHPPATEADRAWTWPTFAGLVGTGITGLTYHSYQMTNWTPEKHTDSRPWSQQLTEFGAKLDPLIKTRIHNELFNDEFVLDEEIFPQIPHYRILLDWASSQVALGPLNFLDGAVHGEYQVPANLAQNVNQIIVPVAPNLNAVNDILLGFFNQTLSDTQLKSLSPENYQTAVHLMSEEMKKQPHAQWSHLVSRRLLFLTLKRQDPEALFILLKSRIGIMMPVLYPLFVSPLNQAVLLAARKNHPQLLSLLAAPRARGPRTFMTILLHRPTLEQARRIATRAGFTAVLEQLDRLNHPEPAPAPEPETSSTIRQTAGHDRSTQRTLLVTILQLKQRYQAAQERIFYHPESAVSIHRQIELRLELLTKANRLTPFEAAAAKALLDRIEAPFNENSQNYDPDNIYIWNTEAKKEKTRELLQIAYLALEDRKAFERQNGRTMTDQDNDDNWSSWIKNVLVDGSLAYAVDAGRQLDLSRIPSVSSCIPGVDHRIIHGLSGLHPDVAIHEGGDHEEHNLRVWERAKAAGEATKRAQFNNSVFDALISEWVQSGANMSPNPVQLVQDYQVFVTDRARTILGESYLGTEEFKTLIETLAEYPSRIIERTQSKTSE